MEAEDGAGVGGPGKVESDVRGIVSEQIDEERTGTRSSIEYLLWARHSPRLQGHGSNQNKLSYLCGDFFLKDLWLSLQRVGCVSTLGSGEDCSTGGPWSRAW